VGVSSFFVIHVQRGHMGIPGMGRLLDVGAKDALVFHPLVLLCRHTSWQVCQELAGKGCCISDYSRLRHRLFHLPWSFNTYAVVAQIIEQISAKHYLTNFS